MRVWLVEVYALPFLLRAEGRETGSLSSLPIIEQFVTQEVSGDFVKQSTVGQVSVSVPEVGSCFEKNPQASHKVHSCCSGPSGVSEETNFSVSASILPGYSSAV